MEVESRGNSACDYTFHMAVTKFDDDTEAQLREIVRDGISSFKIFLAYKNFFGVDDGEMYQTLALAKNAGCHHDCALRERGTRRPTAATAARRRQDRAGVARAEPSGIRRSRGNRAVRDVSREHRRHRVCRSPVLPSPRSNAPWRRSLVVCRSMSNR